MGIQLRKPLFCLFQYLPERNIWFIHCLLGGELSPKVTDEGATGLPNGAREKFRWGDRREPPLFYKERLGTGSPSHPPQCAHWGTFPPRGRLWGDAPDLETFFRKNAFQHIFPRKMRPKSVLAYRRQQPFDRTKANQPQTQRVGTSGHKNRGSRGLAPGPLSPHFSGEMGTPPGRRAPRGAAPRGTGKAPTTRRVRSTLPRPRPGPGGNPRGRC